MRLLLLCNDLFRELLVSSLGNDLARDKFVLGLVRAALDDCVSVGLTYSRKGYELFLRAGVDVE